MAEPGLIDAYLAALAPHLPEARMAELADGLADTYDHHRARGLDEPHAARAALDEFGDARTVLAAFAEQSPPRRVARVQLASAPLLAAAWSVVLIAGHATTWPVPFAAPWALAALTLATFAALLVAVRTTRPRRTRVAALAGCAGLVVLDAIALTFFYADMHAPCWPLYLSAPITSMHLAYAATAFRVVSASASIYSS